MEIKIPFYQVLNILLTGLVLASGTIISFPGPLQSFLHNSKSFWTHSEVITTMAFIAISYEIGLIVNRLGSIVLEPAMVRLRLIPFNKNYKLYNDLKQRYPILEILSREYASSRTCVMLFTMLSAMHVVYGRRSFGLCFFLLAILFAFSWRKHAGKIVTLMITDQTKQEELHNQSKKGNNDGIRN